MDLGPENKPTADRTMLLPILLGVFSLFGILLVFVIGYYNSSRQAVPAPETPTPFKYQLIGTEPGISTAEMTAEESGLSDGTPGSTGLPNLGLVVTAQQGGSSGSSTNTGATEDSSSPPFPDQTSSGPTPTNPVIILSTSSKPTSTSLPFIFRTYTPTFTPGPTWTVTPSRTKNVIPGTNSSFTSTPSLAPTLTPTGSTQVPLTPGTYDDSHPLIAYNGWSSITDSSAYQSTLHVSNTAGPTATATFRFTGQQLHLTFQGSASFGVIRINVGGLNFDLDESNGTNEWVSVLLAQGTYTVTITHTGGGSVNIDSVVIPDFNTPTPTATPTSTSIN